MGHNESMTDDEARAFVNTPHLPKLEGIHLDGWVSEFAEQLLRTRFKSLRCQNHFRPSAPPPGTPPA